MNQHPQYDEFFDLYALGVVEGVECDEFRAHLATCEDCTRKLAEARGRMAELSFAVAPVEPPAGAKEKLLRRVRGETKQAGASVPHVERSIGRSWWAFVLAPVTLALAIATIYLWNSNNHLSEQIRNENVQMQSLQHQLDEANELMNLETAHDTVAVKLMPMKPEEHDHGEVLYNSRMGMAFYTGTLPPVPKDKSYQLWLVPMTGSPISAGVFGEAVGPGYHAIMKMPPGIEAKAFAVTMESAGGVPQPQGPKMLVGPVS